MRVQKKVKRASAKEYKVTVTDNPFSFTVVRNSTNETIFSTAGANFILSDYYLEISN